MSASNSILGLVNSAVNLVQSTPKILIHTTQFRSMGSVRGNTKQAEPSNQPATYEAQPNLIEAPLDLNDPAYLRAEDIAYITTDLELILGQSLQDCQPKLDALSNRLKRCSLDFSNSNLRPSCDARKALNLCRCVSQS
jgi:hypothetical protein